MFRFSNKIVVDYVSKIYTQFILTRFYVAYENTNLKKYFVLGINKFNYLHYFSDISIDLVILNVGGKNNFFLYPFLHPTKSLEKKYNTRQRKLKTKKNTTETSYSTV